MGKVHIGKKIREVLDKSSFTIVDFARKINLTRDGVYKILDKETIATDQLQKISSVLNHDFFNYYQGEFRQASEKNPAYGIKENIDHLNKDLQNLSKVVYVLIEKIDKLESAMKRKPVGQNRKV